MDLKNKKKLKHKAFPNKDNEAKEGMKSESNRIQSKLQTLKEQIEKKKNKKLEEMKKQKLQEKVSKFLKTNQFQEHQQHESESGLQIVMKKLKAQKYVQNVKEKGIKDIEQLLKVSQEDIDGWKDIPIGFRIKIKKFVNQHQKQKEQTQQIQDIQKIMKGRAENRKFVPLTHKSQQFQEFEEEQMVEEVNYPHQEEDQDILMESLNRVFHPRKGILKQHHQFSKKQASKEEKGVHWNQSVKDFNKETSNFNGEIFAKIQYPTQIFHYTSEESIPSSFQIPSLKQKQSHHYCWNCLKKIGKEGVQKEGRSFCAEQCTKLYQNTLQIGSQQKKQAQYEQDEIDLCIW